MVVFNKILNPRLRICSQFFIFVLCLAACLPDIPIPETAVSSARDTVSVEPAENYWPTDSWRESAPVKQGVDPELLNEIYTRELSIDGLVVVRNGYIVAEKYSEPYDQESLHGIYSVTKSILSALIGIAIRDGFIKSLNDPVLDYFPERTFENDDAQKRSITLEHMLTMTSGLEFDWDEMIWSPDFVQYVLDQPMFAEPGIQFNYSSGNAHVLSAILQQTSGLNAEDFAQQYLFEYLGIEDVEWKKDNLGISKGGWGMRMKPRDMAKIGYLYLNKGLWDGMQIIPEHWIKASTQQRYIQVPDPLEPWDVYMGYYWWLHEDNLYAAHGMKGQFIYVIPEQNMVVVITSHVPDSRFSQPQQLIREDIIPSVKPDLMD
jgi:CubicO group peptidase (beta-lactamase class C family)